MNGIIQTVDESRLVNEDSGMRSEGFLTWVRSYRFEIALGVIALVPIVVAVIRAILSGYTPIGDNGLLLLRSRDVFTANHPWLGSASSSSLSLGVAVNNPGPLLFDLMSVPVRVFGSGNGMAIGVGLLNSSCIIAAAIMAHRVGGRVAYLLLLLVAATLACSMGSELLFDVLQPHSLLFPFFLLTILAWAIAEGRVFALPWAVAVASLLIQTHLSYVYIAPATIGFGLVLYLTSSHFAWRRLKSPLAIGVVVAGLLWAQSLWQQVHGPGDSNLDRLVDAASGKYGSTEAIGLSLATRLVGSVVALPPWFLRPSFGNTIPLVRLIDENGPRPPISGLPGVALSTMALALIVGLLTAAAMTSRGFGKRPQRSAVVLALALTVGAVGALAIQPIGAIALAAHQMRWLWPIAAFAAFSLAMCAVGMIGDDRYKPLVISVMICIVSLFNIPTYVAFAAQNADRDATSSVKKMLNRLDVLKGKGTLLFDTETLQFAEPYSGPLFAGLAEKNIPFLAIDDGSLHQIGEGRRYRCYLSPGSPAGCGVKQWFAVVNGDAAYNPPSGWSRAIFVPGLTPLEFKRFKALGEQLRIAGVPFSKFGVPEFVPDRYKKDALQLQKWQHAYDLNSVAVLLRPAP